MRYQNAFLGWLPLVVIISGVCLLVYASVQQNYRQSLNDPQIQMAEDAAYYLARNYTPSAVIPKGGPLDISNTLFAWIAVYDETFKPLQSSASIYGAPPMPPAGVFQAALTGAGIDTNIPGENRVTWQPNTNVRQALVVVHVKTEKGEGKGYVVAGRSMRDVERRVDQLGTFVVIAWLIMVIVTGLLLVIPVYVSRR